jgi:hypothetical protein
MAAVDEGKNAVTVAAGGGRLTADVIIATQYRQYISFWGTDSQQWVDGIAFYTQPDGRLVVNFPNPHYDNGVAKNSASRTNGWYKPTVRVVKNARTISANGANWKRGRPRRTSSSVCFTTPPTQCSEAPFRTPISA